MKTIVSVSLSMALAATLIATPAGVAYAQHDHAMASMHHDAPAGGSDCTTPELRCATVASPFIDARGRLWLTWAANGAVSVASSTDGGAHFGAAVVVGSPGKRLDANADAHPQIAIDGAGRVAVAYSVFKDDRWNAQVMVSTSKDGAAFSPPRSLSQDAASQRFPVTAFEPDGTLFIAWLDKRTVAQARRRGTSQPGAALAYAWSHDAGATFVNEAIAADHTCECCRLDLAFDAARHPVILFRKIYGERERDHAVLTFDDDGRPTEARRVAVDHWEIDGCPHQGPALAVSADGVWHAAWFTAGDARQGLFYARSTDDGRSFSTPQSVGDASRQAERPSLFARGASVWLAWKEFDGERIYAKARYSSDGGRTWSNDRTIGAVRGYADRPLLVGDAKRVYVSWLTREQGYRLISLEP